MKLTAISLFANGSEVAILSFQDPGSTNPYIAKSILGLDADQIVPKFYGHSGSSSKYYSLELDSRDVVVKIGLNPDYSTLQSYSDLRDALAKAIASSRTGLVQLYFKNGADNVALLSGFITRFDAPLFTKTPEVTLTISCDDPMLRGISVVSETFSAGDTTITVNDLVSTAPHGLSFSVLFNATTTAFSIATPQWAFTVTPGTIDGDVGFLVGDQLYFINQPDDKQLFVVRGGISLHLADKITPGSVWPILFPGVNDFVITTGAFSWLSFTYFAAYWGV